jgi:putative NADH-flavin reductase
MMRRYSNCLITGALALIGLVVLPALEAAADTIVVYGASGRVGGVIVAEALARGHDVVGVSRNPASLTNNHDNFSAVAGDVTSLESVLDVIGDEAPDAVIIVVNGIGPGNTADEAITSRAARTYLEAAKNLGAAAPHVIQISGGTTLWVDGVWGLDDPTLEEGTARHGRYYGHWQAIEAYRASDGVTWTVMTPPPGAMSAGERTGEYRLGLEDVLFDADGSSFISTENFAFAVIDEAETAQSAGKRVAVGPPD